MPVFSVLSLLKTSGVRYFFSSDLQFCASCSFLKPASSLSTVAWSAMVSCGECQLEGQRSKEETERVMRCRCDCRNGSVCCPRRVFSLFIIRLSVCPRCLYPPSPSLPSFCLSAGMSARRECAPPARVTHTHTHPSTHFVGLKVNSSARLKESHRESVRTNVLACALADIRRHSSFVYSPRGLSLATAKCVCVRLCVCVFGCGRQQHQARTMLAHPTDRLIWME